MENNNPALAEIEGILNGYTQAPFVNPETQSKSKRGRPKKEQQGAINQPNELQDNSIPESPVISGSLLILMVDLILPNLICFAANKMTRGKKIKANRLQMTAKQREELEPIAEQVAKDMAMKANPMTVLIISLIGIYGVNFMQLKAE
jgi:hypothetical protein